MSARLVRYKLNYRMLLNNCSDRALDLLVEELSDPARDAIRQLSEATFVVIGCMLHSLRTTFVQR